MWSTDHFLICPFKRKQLAGRILWCSKTNTLFLFYNQPTRKDRNPTLKSLSAFYLQLTCMAEEEIIICSFWLVGLFGVIYLLENLTFFRGERCPPASYFSSSHVDNHTGEYVEDSISTVSHKSFSLWDRKTGVRSVKSEGDIEVRVKSTTFSGHGLRVLVGRPLGLAGFQRLRTVETWHFMSCVHGRRGTRGG